MGVVFEEKPKQKIMPEIALLRITEEDGDEFWIVERLRDSRELFILNKAVLVTHGARLMAMRVLLVLQTALMLWLCSGIVNAGGVERALTPDLPQGPEEEKEMLLANVCSVMLVVSMESFIGCLVLLLWEMAVGGCWRRRRRD